jgi:hypothetical protein
MPLSELTATYIKILQAAKSHLHKNIDQYCGS